MFSFKNQSLNLVKQDIFYNSVKTLLLLSLCLSYILFIYFVYLFYSYCNVIANYALFNEYRLLPKVYINYFLIWFEFSIDFFGIVLLFLAYFVGVLSLLALDNRIF